MKENFPNLTKEIDIQVQEAQTSCTQKMTTSTHIIIKVTKVKDKDRTLKAARKKQSYLQRTSHKIISRFLKRNFADKNRMARNIQSDEKQGPTIFFGL